MKTITKKCLTCGNYFEAFIKEHNRGNAKYCSKECGYKALSQNIIPKEPNVSCSLCSKTFYLSPSKKLKSKSGLYFCCRAHKDEAQKTSLKYRALAFRELPNLCKECGYDKYPQVLHVHHIDENRDNNILSNLELLCPTCHGEKHFLSQMS